MSWERKRARAGPERIRRRLIFSGKKPLLAKEKVSCAILSIKHRQGLFGAEFVIK